MKQNKTFTLVLILSFIALMIVPVFKVALAEEDPGTTPDISVPTGVLGCTGVQVSPEDSLEVQQAICNNAEHLEGSSCGVSGHGTCSSPKTNEVQVEGTHCVCLDETSGNLTTETPTE